MENGENIINGWSETEFDNGNRYGLTKREYFAGLAMQGILAKEAHGERIFNEDEGNHSQRTIIAKASVIMADELLAELEKNK